MVFSYYIQITNFEKKILFNSKRKNKQLILFGGKKFQFHQNSNINQKI